MGLDLKKLFFRFQLTQFLLDFFCKGQKISLSTCVARLFCRVSVLIRVFISNTTLLKNDLA